MKKGIVGNLSVKFLERVIIQTSQFIVQILLARMLLVSDYGMVTIVSAAINIANVIIQSGITNAIIQKKELGKKEIDAVNTINLLIAVVLFALLVVFAPVIAKIYGMNLVPYIIVLALTIPVGAISSAYICIYTRHLKFTYIFVVGSVASVLSGIISVLLAYSGAGAWALIIQHLCFALVQMFLFVIHEKGILHFNTNFFDAKEALKFGNKYLLANLITSVFFEAKSLIIAKFYKVEELACYNKGNHFPRFISTAISSTVQPVMLSYFSRLQDDIEKSKEMFLKALRVMSFFIFPAMLGLYAIAEEVIIWLLTEKWVFCVPYCKILCITYVFSVIYSLNAQIINGMGKSAYYYKLTIISNVFSAIIMVMCIICQVDLIGYTIISLLSILVQFVLYSYYNKKYLYISVLNFLKEIIASAVCSVIMLVVIEILATRTSFNGFLGIFKAVVVGILVYFGTSSLLNLKTMRILFKTIKTLSKE